MTTRERFNQVLHWQKPDQLPNVEFGYWEATIVAWHQQGLPKTVTNDVQVEEYFGLDGLERIPFVPAQNGLFPAFERKVLAVSDGNRTIMQDHEGNIVENIGHQESIPRYLRFGLQNRADWDRYRLEHLDYTRPDRIGDLKTVVSNAHNQGLPVRFNAGSFYGWLRNWMGVENFSIALMTEQRWVEEMMDHLVAMSLYLIDQVCAQVPIDLAWWWEDMCYNKGPLMSPRLFEQLLVPRYQQITAALKRYSIDVNVLDCDGQIYPLVPGWLRAGINCMFPIEALHTDPWVLRRTYGENILLIGGVNKLSLIKGRDAIDREIERLQPLTEKGGYLPCVDHRVPPDVSLENYCYYLERKKQLL